MCLALGMIFSACAPKAETPPAATPVADATSAPSADATTAPPAETISDSGTVVYYSMWNEAEPQGAVLNEAIALFQQNTGKTVNVTWVGRTIQDTIRAILNSGEQIDIWDQDLVKQINQNSDAMLDLASYYSKPYDILGGKSLSEAMNPALVNLTNTLSDGKMLGVAYQPYTVVFMYNKGHFEEAGITSTPKTWDEFMDVCQKLKDAGFIPTTIDDAYRDLPLGYALARGKGYSWVEKLVNDKELWKDPYVLSMAKAYEDMAKKGYWDKNVGSAVWPAGQTEVGNGNISMYLTGTWLPNELLPISSATVPDLEWGAFNFPTTPGGAQQSTAAMYGAQGFFIPASSQNADAAFELIATFVSPEFDTKMSAGTAGIPLSPTAPWPEIIAGIKPTFDETTEWMPWGGGLDSNPDTKTKALPEFAKLIAGEITAEQFVAAMSQ